MTKYKIKKNDMVVVIRGAEKNKSGKVLEVQKSRGRVLVEGINVRKRAVRRTQEQPQGGIVEQEQPVHISNVMEESRYKAKVQVKHQNSTKQEANS